MIGISEFEEIDMSKGQTIKKELILSFHKVIKERKLIIKFVGVGIIIGLIVAFSLPKIYTSEVILAPESSKVTGGGISSMASMLGLSNMGMGSDVDALNIRLFPNIVSSTPFLLELLDTKISDDKNEKTLSEYLDGMKEPWWSYLVRLPQKTLSLIKSIFTPGSNAQQVGTIGSNINNLTAENANKLKIMRTSLICNVDKKTGVTTLSVSLQNPNVVAKIADSVLVKLQKYITTYRINKAQQDCDYLESLFKERQREYYESQEKYAKYQDTNQNIIKRSASTERERLQNEMNLAFQVYTQVATQLQVARAKVQEAKPVFAVIEPAIVPLIPSSMGKMKILILWIVISIILAVGWILVGKDFLTKVIACAKTLD